MSTDNGVSWDSWLQPTCFDEGDVWEATYDLGEEDVLHVRYQLNYRWTTSPASCRRCSGMGSLSCAAR